MHGTLDWCVRNSYSPRHHENIGRCVLHAAHVTCASSAQGQSYEAAALPPGPLPLRLALADAVTVQPLLRPEDFDALRAYVARVRTPIRLRAGEEEASAFPCARRCTWRAPRQRCGG